MTMIHMKPMDALQRLKEGNRKFVSGSTEHPTVDNIRLKQLDEEGQTDHAFATVVTCSDSRVVPEIIFDCGLGDLFVIRNAGNACLGEESLCSIEFGLTNVKTQLLLVMGHSSCGAITSALGYCQGLDLSALPNTGKYAAKLAGVLPFTAESTENEIEPAAQKNVLDTITRLRHNIPCIREKENDGSLIVAGAYYTLSTGRVSWL